MHLGQARRFDVTFVHPGDAHAPPAVLIDAIILLFANGYVRHLGWSVDSYVKKKICRMGGEEGVGGGGQTTPLFTFSFFLHSNAARNRK